MVAGDNIRLASPGGGGFGRAVERDLAMVERDLNRGYISRATAEQTYGVVVAEAHSDAAGHMHYALDVQASVELRKKMAQA